MGGNLEFKHRFDGVYKYNIIFGVSGYAAHAKSFNDFYTVIYQRHDQLRRFTNTAVYVHYTLTRHRVLRPI